MIGFILAAVVVFCALWVCLGVWNCAKPIVKAKTDGLADRWTVARMTHHGIHNLIPAPTCDKATGKCVFKRDGRKVKL